MFAHWPNEYGELNIRLCPGLRLSEYTRCWRLDELDRRGEPRWGRIPFPAVDSYCVWRLGPSFHIEGLRWHGEEVTALRPFGGPNLRREVHWAFGPQAADRIVSLLPGLPRVAGLWTSAVAAEAQDCPLGPTSSFPPAWAHLCALKLEGYEDGVVWNRENSVVRAADAEGVEWWSSRQADRREGRPDPDPLEIKEEIVRTPGRAAVWLLHQLLERREDLWAGLVEQVPEFIGAVWQLVASGGGLDGGCQPQPLCHIKSGIMELRDVCVFVTPSAYGHRMLDDDSVTEVLPDPGPDWRIEVVKGDTIE